MKRIPSLLFLFVLLSATNFLAVRNNPRFGRPTWTMIKQATPQPIERADAIGGVITIDTSGNYELYENLGNIKVEITSDLVFLDLNGHEISHNSGSEDIITIDANQVVVSGGVIKNTDTNTPKSGTGILVNPGVSDVFLERLLIFNCGNGVFLNGQENFEVFNCTLKELDLIGNAVGVRLHSADENAITDCIARKGTQSGFEMLYCKTNCFKSCCALEIAGDESVTAFKSDSGKCNLFENCAAKKTKTTATDFGNTVHGFLLTGTEEETKIIDCVVNDTEATGEGNAVAYGIQLQPTLLPEVEEGTLTQLESRGKAERLNIFRGIWSPNTRYIYTSVNREDLQTTPGRQCLFGFDEEYLSAIFWDQISSGTKTDCDPDWSPDGRHIAYCDQDGNFPELIVERRDGARVIDLASFSDTNGINTIQSRWSGNGMFIAYIRKSDSTSFANVYIRDFDGEQLPNRISSTGSDIYLNASGLSWSPDDRYIAVAYADGLALLLFSEGGDIDRFTANTDISDLTAVTWSPNGKFIAAGDATKLYVYSFENKTTLNLLDDEDVGTPVTSIAWSPCGRYIVKNGSFGGGADHLSISRFDPDATSGSRIVEIANAQLLETVLSVDWSACGKYILGTTPEVNTGGNIVGLVVVFPVMNCPTNCLLERNTVGDTKGYETLLGIGIAGGGANSFFSNISYHNGDDFSYGVPNVFYDDQNNKRPFDNIATQRAQYLMFTESLVDGRTSNMD